MITRLVFQNLRRIKLLFMIVVLAALLGGCGSTTFSDGEYAVPVILSGGSGKASLESPAKLIKNEKGCELEIVFSSSHYDYIISDGIKYECINNEGNSTFRFPVDEYVNELSIIADTTAMSKPHEIDYRIELDYNHICQWNSENSISSGIAPAADRDAAGVNINRPEVEGVSFMPEENDTAELFCIYHSEQGIDALSVSDGDVFIILPDGAETISGIPSDYHILKRPVNNIYLAATAAMTFFDRINALENVKYSSLEESGWSVEAARDRMKNNELIYAGKYSAPDYELLLTAGCNLAVESTMILHTPEVKEKLLELNIPVFTDYSSHEKEPLGRVEWVKVYGLLTGNEEEALEAYAEQKSLFDEQKLLVLQEENEENTEKKVVVFYINSNNQPVVRRKNDYISRIIELSGGRYIFDDTEGSSPTLTMTLEQFYKEAKDADVLIYNPVVVEAVADREALLNKAPLLKDFKAVKDGEVYILSKDMYQETMSTGELLRELTDCFRNKKTEHKYLLKL